MAGNNLSVQKTFKPQVFNSGKFSKGLSKIAIPLAGSALAFSIKAQPVEARNPRIQEPIGLEQLGRIDKTSTPPKLAQINLTRLSIGVTIRLGNTTVKIEKIFRGEGNNTFYKAGSNYYLLRGGRFIPAKYYDGGRGNSHFEVPDYKHQIEFRLIEEPRVIYRQSQYQPSSQDVLDFLTNHLEGIRRNHNVRGNVVVLEEPGTGKVLGYFENSHPCNSDSYLHLPSSINFHGTIINNITGSGLCDQISNMEPNVFNMHLGSVGLYRQIGHIGKHYEGLELISVFDIRR